MKARVVTVHIEPDKTDEAAHIYRDSVVPAAREMGCKGLFMATNRSTGKGISITFWDEDKLQRSEASAYLQEQFAKFADVFSAPPTRELFDVSLWERAPVKASHVRIVTVQTRPGRLDDLANQYRESVVPAAREQKGFLGAMLLTDPATGKSISATAWQTLNDLEGSEASGYFQTQLGALGDILAAPPIREVYELTIREVSA